MPYHRDARPLRWCGYKPILNITRCLHLAEAIQSYKTGKFQPRGIHSTVVDRLKMKVLWFSATKPTSANNKYGNVSYTLPMDIVMERFGIYLYFIDQVVFSSHTSTRILLTKVDHEQQKLTNVGFSAYGSPLKMNPEDNLWYHAFRCLNDEDMEHDHEMELGIEVDDEDQAWLYNNSVKQPNNHTLANKPTPYGTNDPGFGCHHYNYYGQQCPTPLSEEDTRRILFTKCPRLVQTCTDYTSKNNTEGENEKKLKKQKKQKKQSVAKVH